MDFTKVSRSDRNVKALINATYPDYKGKKVYVSPRARLRDVTSYWDGGTRHYYKVIDLATLAGTPRVMDVPQNGTIFDGGALKPDGLDIPVGFAVVEHTISSGRDIGLTIHVHPDSMQKFLPEPEAPFSVHKPIEDELLA